MPPITATPLTPTTVITLALLAGGILAVWLQRVPINDPGSVAPWTFVFGAAVVLGLGLGVLHAPAVIALAAFIAAAHLTDAAGKKYARLLFGALTAVLAFALAIHRLPGFSNPVVIAGAVFSPGAAAFTQYANFDKGAVGLILLAFICRRTRSRPELARVVKQTLPILLATVTAVLGLSLAVGYVRPDFKLPGVTPLFLLTNLFFTVIAEEAFFRGFLQARLASALGRFRHGPWIAVACSALLFGAAHAAGGPTYMLLASVAGLGYAYAYHVTQRVEASILIHITLNAVHFIGFTYPYLATAVKA